VTEANFYWEMEKSMVAFANLKKAEWAYDLEEQERKGDWGDLGPRVFRDIPRRTHDDGFDEYDDEEEEWETQSQEEERRQEMAEEQERQMEAEEMGEPACAGCACDCGDNMSKGCCGHVCPPCRSRGAWVEV